MNFKSRINLIKTKLRKSNLDAAFFTSRENRRYLSGFTGSDGILMITRYKIILLVDSRYIDQAKKETKGVKIIGFFPGENYVDSLCRIIKEEKWKRIGFNESRVSVKFLNSLKKKVKNVRLVSLGEYPEKMRGVKDKGELKNIRIAIKIAEKAFKKVVPRVKPGISEKDVQTELIYRLRKFGSEELPFEPLVASGRRTVFPHALPSKNRLKRGEMVVIDFGARFSGYSSDITRTIVLGKMNEKHKKIFKALRQAEEAARKMLRDGVKCKDVDKAVRESLKKEGLDKYFLHGAGHGIGLAVHEAPKISKSSKDILKKGMVVTIEPGIYIPRFGGVRIEDMYLVLKRRAKKLTSLPRIVEV